MYHRTGPATEIWEFQKNNQRRFKTGVDGCSLGVHRPRETREQHSVQSYDRYMHSLDTEISDGWEKETHVLRMKMVYAFILKI